MCKDANEIQLCVSGREVDFKSSSRATLAIRATSRKAEDVFPTAYRLNTRRATREVLSRHTVSDNSYTYSCEPQYFLEAWLHTGCFSLSIGCVRLLFTGIYLYFSAALMRGVS